MTDRVCATIEVFLRQKGYKLTKSRREVIRIFRQAATPLSVSDVHQRLAETAADLASIYRTIHLLCDLGVITKLEFHEHTYRYELSDLFAPHHHHLICRNCGIIENLFNECLPVGLEEKILAQAGFQVESHVLEFFGTCRNCSK